MFDKIFDVNVKMCPGLRVFDYFLSSGAHAFLSCDAYAPTLPYFCF